MTINDIKVVSLNYNSNSSTFQKLSFTIKNSLNPKFILQKVLEKKIRNNIKKDFKLFFNSDFNGSFFNVEHHLSHIASAYFFSPFNNSVLLSLDGFGDFSSTAWGLGINDKITLDQRIYFLVFFGEVHGEEKNNYYKKALVSILPSYNENFGYVIAESLSFNTPVITTTNTPWTFIEKKKCGWLVDTEVVPLAKKLSIILNLRSNLFYQRGLNGFRYVEKYYDINKIYIKYFRLYKSVLKINK